ncbi:MAG: FG-GAP-like repeat-containing protein [Acidobacteriaceae bacterium]
MGHTVRNLFRGISAATFAAVFAVSASAHAQTVFQPLTALNTKSVTLPAGTTPKGVAVADFNHDGYPDLVVANFADTSQGTDGSISVYLSNSAGVLQAPVKYPTCGGPTAVLAEDLDLTGLPDIVVTCNTPTSNVIQVFLNLGNGTFDPTEGNGTTNIVLGTGKGPVSITSGDFNSDGHPDLAVADSGDGTVTLFLSNPANNFTYYTVQTLQGLGTPTAITTGYFNSTGHLGLAVTDSSTNTVRILLGDGTGDFAPISTSPTGKDPNGIVAGDFNQDGNTDLAVVNAGDGTVSVLLGQGNGSFASTTPISVGPSTGTGASSIIALDIYGTGNLDLITANTLQNNVAVLINTGNANFQAAQDYAVPNGPAYLAVGDFNRDGKPDLAVTQSTGNTVSLLINNTLPTPEPGGLNYITPHTLTHGHGNMATGVATGDFNHDGYPDIAATYFEDNSVQVLTGRGGGNFNTATVYPVGKQPYWITAGDLNNDGYDDLVTANTTDGTISILMNKGDGSGTFNAAQTLTVGALPYQVAIGDLNGDGIPDIAVANYGDNTVTILYGPFNTPFQTIQALPTCTNPYGVAIGDFRHTGQNDIAVTCFHTAQLEVFLNNGMLPYQPPVTPTTFQSGALYTTDVDPTSLVIGDFNRDGNLDIVTGNSTANDVSFFAGNGDGTFKSAVNSFALNFPDSIAAGDFNGDGIPDLVTVAPNFNQVAVLLGKGDGTFQPRMEFPTIGGSSSSVQQPWAVALADFNRDGKLDIVTANTFNRVNLTIPAYQTMYMNEFPPVGGGHPSLSVLLNGSGTNISFTISPSGTIPYGTPVTLTGTVAPTLGTTTPTGNMILEDTDGTPMGPIPLDASGSASLTVANPGSGMHQITALYSGDTLYQPFTKTGPAFKFTVSGTIVALTVSPNPATPTSVISYSVVIGTAGASNNNPIGTITLYGILPNGTVVQVDGPNPVGTAGKGGITNFSKTLGSGYPPGNYYLYAVFNPTVANGNPAGSSPQVLVIDQ